MRRKLVRVVLAAALCLALALTLGAAAGRDLVEPSYGYPSVHFDCEVIVLNYPDNLIFGGFIVSVCQDKTYIVTDATMVGSQPLCVLRAGDRKRRDQLRRRS